MSNTQFHEPNEQPSTRWVTLRRYRELEAKLAKQQRYAADLFDECKKLEANLAKQPQFKAAGFVNKGNGCTHTHYNELLPDGKRILYLAIDKAMEDGPLQANEFPSDTQS